MIKLFTITATRKDADNSFLCEFLCKFYENIHKIQRTAENDFKP